MAPGSLEIEQELLKLGVNPVDLEQQGKEAVLRLSEEDRSLLFSDTKRREQIVELFRSRGFKHVSVELSGGVAQG